MHLSQRKPSLGRAGAALDVAWTQNLCRQFDHARHIPLIADNRRNPLIIEAVLQRNQGSGWR